MGAAVLHYDDSGVPMCARARIEPCGGDVLAQ